MNAPDADALSILLPAGNGNATQINILEGNVLNPQFGLGGNGANTSHNTTVGALISGLGNGEGDKKDGSPSSTLFGPIALGGATGNGNVTQVNILSYNIFNPQFSLRGGNFSDNTTISNVATNNGNNNKVDSTGGTSSLFGGAIGNGNTTQLSLFSGNIFNPQFSLFGDNVSNNVAVTNVAAGNGNGSTTSVKSGGLLGTSLIGMTGNGNTNQFAAFTSNIFNPQVSLLGRNTSNNNANANQASGNGNNSGNEAGSTGGLGNIVSVGSTGNGNTTQNATGSGNIYNDQWNFGLGNFVPAPSPPPNPDAKPTNQEVAAGSGSGQQGLTNEQLTELKPGSKSSTGTVVSGRPLQNVAKRVQDAVNGTLGRIAGPKKPTTAGSPDSPRASGKSADN